MSIEYLHAKFLLSVILLSNTSLLLSFFFSFRFIGILLIRLKLLLVQSNTSLPWSP